MELFNGVDGESGADVCEGGVTGDGGPGAWEGQVDGERGVEETAGGVWLIGSG